MNQNQRKFLVDKIQSKTNEQVKKLRNEIPTAPKPEIYILKAALSGKLKLQNNETILEWLDEKVQEKVEKDVSFVKSGNRWNSDDEGVNHFTIPVKKLIDMPNEYVVKLNEYKQKSFSINKEIKEIQEHAEGLITRINLASPKTLDTIIAEIDDLGDLSLMDEKLRKIIAPELKQLKK